MTRRVRLRNTMELMDAWGEYLEDHPEAEWKSISYLDADEQEVEVLSGSTFWDLLFEHYASFKFNDPLALYASFKPIPYADADALRSFRGAWSNFIDIHPEFAYLGELLNRRDYDPLENYDKKEEGGWKDTNSLGEKKRTTDDDAVHKMKYAELTTTTVNDPKLKTKTTGYVYPDDGGTELPDTASITEPVRADAQDVDTVRTTTPLHTDESSVEGNLVVTDAAATDTVTRLFQSYRVHGNVGVTTAVQMMEGELRMRMKNVLPLIIIKEFAREHMCLRREVVYYDD